MLDSPFIHVGRARPALIRPAPRLPDTDDLLLEKGTAMVTIRMPDHLAEIRDAAINHALGKGPLPTNIEELYYWLFWESDEMNLEDFDFRLFLPLSRLDLSDAAICWELKLNRNAPINDTMRLQFARKEIARYVQYPEDLVSAHEAKIERKDGDSTLVCCTVESMGQGGPHPTWHGFFPTQENFWGYLRETGYLYCADEPHIIDEGKILGSWSRSLRNTFQLVKR